MSNTTSHNISHLEIPSKKAKQLHENNETPLYRYDEMLKRSVINENIDILFFKRFYESFGFKWCCGLEKGLVSRKTTDVFKYQFNGVLNSLEIITGMSKKRLKSVFEEFTNSRMFETIYYRTNPDLSKHCGDLYSGISEEDYQKFIHTFWVAIDKTIEIRNRKKNIQCLQNELSYKLAFIKQSINRVKKLKETIQTLQEKEREESEKD